MPSSFKRLRDIAAIAGALPSLTSTDADADTQIGELLDMTEVPIDSDASEVSGTGEADDVPAQV